MTNDSDYLYNSLTHKEKSGRHTHRVTFIIDKISEDIEIKSYNTNIYQENDIKIRFDNSRYSNTTSRHQSGIISYLENNYLLPDDIYDFKKSRRNNMKRELIELYKVDKGIGKHRVYNISILRKMVGDSRD
jgi:uncharacterized protein YvpB